MRSCIFVIMLILIHAEILGQTNFAGNDDFRRIQQAFYDGFQGDDADTAEWSEFNRFKRWEMFWGPRSMPSGKINDAVARYSEASQRLLRDLKNIEAEKAVWAELGPKRNGLGGIGRIDAIAFHPVDTGVIYVASPVGGVWISYDGGGNWQNLNTDGQLPVIGVSSIAIDANNPGVLFIATGDVDSQYTYSCGIYRSTDAGQSWAPAGLNELPGNFTIGKILLHPVEPEVALAATSLGIYRTLNRNDVTPQWQKVYPAEPDSFVLIRNIAFHPDDPLTLYAAGIDILSSAQGGTTGTWNSIATAGNGLDFAGTPWPAVFNGEEYVSCLNLAVAPQGDFLYVNCITRDDPPPHNWQSAVHKHIFRYDIAADLWEIMPTAYLYSGITPGRMEMAVSPQDSKRVYCGGVRLKVFDPDTPEHPWNMVDFNSHIDFHELVFSPWEENVLYAGTDGGLYKKNLTEGPAFIDGAGGDNGSQNSDGGFYRKGSTGMAGTYPTVELNNGLGISTMYNFASSPLDPYQILAGYQDCGICYLKDNIWRMQENPSDGFQCLMDATDSNLMYCTIYHPTNGSLYRSVSDTDDPSWQNILNGQAPVNEPSWFGASLVADPADTKTLFQARINLWKTDDASTATIFDWYKITDVDLLTSALWGNDNCVIFAMEIAPSDPDVIYFTGVKVDSWVTQFDANRVFKTTTGGGINAGDWIDITPPTPGNPLGTYFITDVAVSSTSPEEIWISYSGFLQNYKVKHFDGTDWFDMNEGLPNVPVNCIVYVSGSNDALFAGTDLGVYFRDASLDHWERYGSGLPNVKVTWLEINHTNQKLRAGTFGRGLWETDIPLTSIEKVVNGIGAIPAGAMPEKIKYGLNAAGVSVDVSPNPAGGDRSEVSVEIQTPERFQMISLRILNLNGIVMIDKKLAAGSRRQVIDVSQWPGGVYFAMVFNGTALAGKTKFVLY